MTSGGIIHGRFLWLSRWYFSLPQNTFFWYPWFGSLIASSSPPCNRFAINHKDIILVWCLQWPFAIMGNLLLQKWGIPFATLSNYIMQQTQIKHDWYFYNLKPLIYLQSKQTVSTWLERFRLMSWTILKTICLRKHIHRILA